MIEQFTKASLAVEHKGQLYFVVIPDGALNIALNMIAGFSPNQTLKLVKAPEGFTVQELGSLSK